MFNAQDHTASDVSRRTFIAGAAAGLGIAAAGVAGVSAHAAESAASDAKASAKTDAKASGKTPKYVFLFIGDGMGNEQVQVASFYKGATEHDGAVVQSPLGFMGFPHVASVTTFDSSSFCPDSASTATSIATGHKTLSGTINMDPETLTESYETIAEKLHSQKGYKIGVLTSVNMNHATPAAFYAHQSKRSKYYEIGQELASSGFEFFAGGAFLGATGDGKDDKLEDLADVAADNGYTVVKTQADAKALEPGSTGSDRVLILAETVADGGAMSYDMDAAADEWRLADYVQKGIDLLTADAKAEDAGFFMMCEGGKIDWACHANDAAACIGDVLALDQAVSVAKAFYDEHPDETLILVTADHETGGLGIGYKTTNYDTFLPNLASQTMSYAKFDSDVAADYAKGNVSFEQALADVEKCFGLVAKGSDAAAGMDPAGKNGSLVMTDEELEELRTAFERTVTVGAGSQAAMSEQDYELYGSYQPFSMTMCHILNHKSGLDHTTYAHTGAPVSIWAIGAGAEEFDGSIDNTDIYAKLAALTEVE